MKRPVAVAALLSGVAVVVVATVLVAGAASGQCSFDSAAWSRAMAAPETSYQRYELAGRSARRLVRCDDVLVGKTRAQVAEKLGPPADATRRRSWSYDIGVPEPRSDYSTLDVEFDENGHVARVRVPGFVEP